MNILTQAERLRIRGGHDHSSQYLKRISERAAHHCKVKYRKRILENP